MNNLVQFCVTTTVETALNKLNRGNIAVYKLRKRGREVYFSVKEEYTQKVFAIFSHACYNVCIKRAGAKARVGNFLKRRFGLIVGAAAFAAACIIANSLVLSVKIVGSGSYLSEQVLAITRDCGARIGTFCGNLDKPLLTSRILALPNVTFCSVQRRGSYLIIEVQTDEQHSSQTDSRPLVSDCDGEIYRIVVLSGTAEKAEGDAVRAGETLIGAYRLTESGESQSALAVGFAEIKRSASITLFFESESEQNALSALAATALYSDNVIEKSFKVNPCEGGVNYDVDFTYIVTLSINMQ